jgi:hypothetical protein
MKIVFLDMDGVLNSAIFFKRTKLNQELRMSSDEWWAEMVDADAVAFLNDILEATGAKVVISSTWRMARDPDEMQKILEVRGFKGEVIGATPRGGGTVRGLKIKRWLDETELAVESFVILDDGRDMDELLPRLVNTTWKYGLRKKHVEQAVRLLNKSA